MIIFASDLDNTLIYSQRRNLVGAKKCIEIYKEKEISYMTETSLCLLNEIQKKILLVPITTRSNIGYGRIDFSDIGQPKYALVCNGGMLLVDGVVDKQWYDESLELIKESDSILEEAIVILEKDANRVLDVRKVEGLFIFTKSADTEKTVAQLKGNLEETLVDIFSQGEKIYVLPKNLNKGEGLLRLKKYLSPEKIIVAGDTIFDVPMLKLGDESYFPEDIKEFCGKFKNGRCILESEGNFSDVLLQLILEG